MSNRITGTIIEWRGSYGFIRSQDGDHPRLFIHQSDADIDKSKLREGTFVSFEVGTGRNGRPAAKLVRLSGENGERPVSAPKSERFLNPYNFVRYLPPRPVVDVPDVLGLAAPPTHDRWIGLSGQIDCTLTAVTPLFVSSSEGVDSNGAKKPHHSYEFMKINGQKAISASTLRGTMRSVFEAATNSTFSNFGGERLSYRLDSREVQKLVPARVEKDEKDGRPIWSLLLLPGEMEIDPEVGQKKGLYAAATRFYKAIKSSGKPQNYTPKPVSGAPDDWTHGEEYYAVLRKVKFPPSRRALALAKSQEQAQHLRRDFDGDIVIRKGWLCKTNQNADNKNSERFFYFENDAQRIPLPTSVRAKYEDLIQDYQRRHEAEVAKRKNSGKAQGNDIAFSRFVLPEFKDERKLKGGELVYVRLQRHANNLKAVFMAPVSWPRVAYDRTIGDLLPKYLHPQTDMSQLDVANRVFGWVNREERVMNDQRPRAYAGRVKFTHAFLQGDGNPQKPMTLSILGSPKPTTTRFYLADPKGKAGRVRRDKDVGYDGNNGRNRLRGRKAYRHYIPSDEHLLSSEQSDQNRTIRDAEGVGSTFTFTVTYESLAPAELGALFWTLALGGEGYHKIGYGKPLGLGSCEVRIDAVTVDDHQVRYRSLDDSGVRELNKDDQTVALNAFFEGMVRPYANDKVVAFAEENNAWGAIFMQLPNIIDLLKIQSKEAPTLPVHYPYSLDPRSNGSFEWFVGNNRLNGPRIELGLAAEDEGLPFINRKGKVGRA